MTVNARTWSDAAWSLGQRSSRALEAGQVVIGEGVRVAAGVAAFADLVEQPGSVAAALARALVQVGPERVQLAGTWSLPAPVCQLLPGGGAGVALDGVQAPAQVPGDLPQPALFGQQSVDQRVVAPGAVGVLPGRLRRGGRRLLVGSRRGTGFCQAGAVRGDAPLDGLGEVLLQVEPVGDLDRVRRPGAGPVGTGA